MKPIKLFLLVLVFLLASCSSDGSFDEGPIITITSPGNDQSFAAGERISLEVAMTNFELGPPNNAVVSDDHQHEDGVEAEHEHEEEMMAEHEHEEGVEEEHSHEASVSRHPQSENLAPGSRDGHYHIYLDAGADGDDHVTTWDQVYDYDLPLDLAAGTHSLRVELRDNEHRAVERVDGSRIEDVVFFTVE